MSSFLLHFLFVHGYYGYEINFHKPDFKIRQVFLESIKILIDFDIE